MHRLGPCFILIAMCNTTALAAQERAVEHEITIPGFDYAFQVPDTLPAGWTAIRFENKGQVDHELILVRLREGKTMADVFEVLQQGGERETVMDAMGGILIADPGETTWGRILVDLEPGRTYMLICNFQDEEEAPSHAELGMIGTFTVR